MTSSRPALQLSKVTKSYLKGGTKTTVLSEVSLDLYPGKVTLAQGPSGSGKSSIIRVAGLLSYPDSGEVLIRGEAPPRRSLASIRRHHLGIVFQNANLLTDLTADENLAVASLRSTRQGRRRLLRAWGLEDLADRPAAALSGGESQRVAFCRALMNDPAVLLLDEPSAGLDQVNTDLVKDMIRSCRSAEKAILLVSHDPAMAELADDRYDVVGGRCV